jgi:multidrug efflux pump subunit AcrA (membrane-fusion protein)
VLHSVTEQSLGFPRGGRITAINVSVGDHVVAGQPLAQIDTSPQQAALRKVQDEVIKQQAALDQISAQDSPERARAELSRFRDLLEITRRNADKSHEADNSTIRSLQRQLSTDRANLRRLEREQRVDRARCPDYPTAPSSGTSVSVTSGSSGSNDSGIPGDEGPCEFLESRFDSIAGIRRQIVVDETSIDAQRRRRDANDAQQQTSIANVEASVKLAQDKTGISGTDTHFTTIEQQQTLDEVKTDLAQTQQAVASTELKASSSGIVEAIYDGAGKVVPAAYHAGLDPVVASPQRAGPGMADPNTFIVLGGVHTFQVSASVPKARGDQITVGQAADMTVEAIPGLHRTATVTRITPSTLPSGEPGYDLELALTQMDPRLSDGMAAQVHIVTGALHDVLVVPTAAVRGLGDAGTVWLVSGDGRRSQVPVSVGVVGTDNTQLIAGVKDGDQVFVPAQ